MGAPPLDVPYYWKGEQKIVPTPPVEVQIYNVGPPSKYKVTVYLPKQKGEPSSHSFKKRCISRQKLDCCYNVHIMTFQTVLWL